MPVIEGNIGRSNPTEERMVALPDRRGCLFQAPEEALSSLQVPVNGIADRNRCE
jgi:hypothetical protein